MMSSRFQLAHVHVRSILGALLLLGAIALASMEAAGAELVESTRSLNGIAITYKYTSGRAYNLKFEERGVSYRFLTGSKPEKWWGPFPYTAYEVEPDEFMLSWFEKEFGDHVTLLVDFETKLIYGSALIRGKEVHFHGAELQKVEDR